ncbi:MAG: glucose 1-dehydrogenase, partial [Nitrospiraceae bacterium]|nr:glucose 1-dehydrogenase [Nitrospiraceae bacterium]
MKAIALKPQTRDIRIAGRAEPSITAPDEIKIQVLRVGICGTDREEAAGGRAMAPAGGGDLVIGHEMFGKVVETGRDVSRVKPGDFAVFTVRRGCGKCLPCAMNRPDMCRTGDYRERGIWGLDGYQTEYVVDREQYVVKVPAAIQDTGVLIEPLSVAEKAIDEAVRLQSARLPDACAAPAWLSGKRCLVAGLGPIGLLAALALRIRGARVYGLDIVDPGTARPKWIEEIGGNYIDGRNAGPGQKKAGGAIGQMDMIFEAAGIAALDFNLLDALASNGVYVLTGIPGGDRPLQIDGAELMRRLVLFNQVMAGSVNAAHGHFQMAVNDLLQAGIIWSGHAEKLITQGHRI